LNAAFKDVLHIKFLTDFRGGLPGHDSRGRRSNDAEMLGVKPPKLRGDHVSQAGAEVVLLGIIAAIGKGKHDEADLFLSRRMSMVPAVCAVGDQTQNGYSGDAKSDSFLDCRRNWFVRNRTRLRRRW